MKKIISAITAAAIAASISVPVLAKEFPDVTTQWDWAKPYIDDMSEMGLINGYEDGTFRPGNSVTHQEALALFARAMGSSDSANAELVEKAYKKYESVISKYDIYAKNEVAFLLYRGALKESELDTYIRSDVRDTPMKRYEAAIVITKAMGGETEAKANLLTDLSYVDAKEIPTNAVQYVYYVTEHKIMQGMGNGEFSSNTEVLRSQMAVMLYNTVDAMQLAFEKAKLMELETGSRNIRLKDVFGEEHLIGYNNNTQMYVDGVLTPAKDVVVGVDAVFTYSGDELLYVDTMTSIPDEHITGKYSGFSNVGGVLKINMYPTSTPTKLVTYECAKNVSINYNEAAGTINSFKKDDYISIDISGGLVQTLRGETKETKIVSATVESIDINDDLAITISHAEAQYNGLSLGVTSDVVVTKNGDATTLNNIYKGDKVNLTLQYGIITKIQATSVKKTVDGVIEEIMISSTPTMVVKTSTGSETYQIPNSVQILINNQEATLYDFRVGDSISITIDSKAITKITATTSQSISKMMTGVVTAVNASYGFIKIATSVNGVSQEETVFCSDGKTMFLSTESKEIKMTSIAIGQTVTVRGAVKNGAFSATLVMIESK